MDSRGQKPIDAAGDVQQVWLSGQLELLTQRITGSSELVGERLSHLSSRFDAAQAEVGRERDIVTKRLEDIDSRVDEIDRWRARTIGVAIGAALGGGVTGGGIVAAVVQATGQG